MSNLKSKIKFIVAIGMVLQNFTSCKSEKTDQREDRQVQTELAIIDSLLRDTSFTGSMAKSLDSSYYVGVGQPVPAFLTPADDTTVIIKLLRDEKIATNLASFYALECGVGLLSVQTNTKPGDWLKKIVDGTADSNSVFMLNRFANATWKASQPFRELSRISQPGFAVASSLAPEELGKEYFRIQYSAKKLLSDMNAVKDSGLSEQMQLLRRLLQDTVYAVQMASFLDSSRAASGPGSDQPFPAPGEDTATLRKTSKQIKIATSIAGFYALESAVNYLVTKNKELPSTILKSLLENSMDEADKTVFARFANATWKAGQPFRDLKRITRATFTPFYFLNEADIEKDMVQIRAAAVKLLGYL